MSPRLAIQAIVLMCAVMSSMAFIGMGMANDDPTLTQLAWLPIGTAVVLLIVMVLKEREEQRLAKQRLHRATRAAQARRGFQRVPGRILTKR